MDVEYVIVGQGLAGTALAWQLSWAGRDFVVIDAKERYTSSKVAAGLITAITGKRLVRSWRLDECWNTSVEFYRRVERECGITCFHEKPVLRVMWEEPQLAVYQKKITGTEFDGVLNPDFEPLAEQRFDAGWGQFEMTRSGYVDTGQYLPASRELFASQGRFHACSLDPPTDIDCNDGNVLIKPLGLNCRRVIFCQGYGGVNNPWFDDLDFNAAKGEILTIHAPELREQRIVHGKVWLLPIGDDHYRAGATYSRETFDCIPTQAGRAEICGHLDQLLKVPYEVVDHVAAVRPILFVQVPILGMHPEHPRLGVFNGLGSKGVLQSPMLAAKFVDHLTNGTPLEDELNYAARRQRTLERKAR